MKLKHVENIVKKGPEVIGETHEKYLKKIVDDLHGTLDNFAINLQAEMLKLGNGHIG